MAFINEQLAVFLEDNLKDGRLFAKLLFVNYGGVSRVATQWAIRGHICTEHFII